MQQRGDHHRIPRDCIDFKVLGLVEHIHVQQLLTCCRCWCHMDAYNAVSHAYVQLQSTLSFTG